MKFLNLLKKELRELINAQMIFGLVITVVLLFVIGNFMSSIMNEASDESGVINISDHDNTDFTHSIISYLEASDFKVNLVNEDNSDRAELLKEADCESLLIIPEGFTDSVLNVGTEPSKLELISSIHSTAALSMLSDKTSYAVQIIEDKIRNEMMLSSGMSEEAIQKIGMPFTLDEVTVVKDKSTNANSQMLVSLLQTQSMLVPIVVFILVMFTSQMIISAISTEKIDKTLETLLSAPVSRVSVLSAKMLAAGIIAVINAVVYMIGMSSMLKGQLNTEVIGEALSINDIMKELGLKIGFSGYVLIGLQMFMTIMICLAVSLILGAMVNDAKSAQTMVMPIMVLAMIPYLVSMLYDVNLLSPALKTAIYAIPFTHTFNSMNNIIFGNMDIYWMGFGYQVVLLVICMFLAVKFFTSDKIFTISLNFGQKRKLKKNSQ